MHTTLKAAVLSAGTALTIAATPAPVADWVVDPNHTEIGFSVKHFFTPVRGKFDSFQIDLDYDAENPTASTLDVRIDVASVNTNNTKRDNHLQSGDFFEADRFPHITFESSSIRAGDEGVLLATGTLTIKGVSREVELPIETLGVQDIPTEMREMLGGASKIASFRTVLNLDRGDYGVGVGNWAATLVVGGTVDVEIALEAALR